MKAVLDRLPRHQPLILASDPDGLLADPELQRALEKGGYRLVREEGNLRLWGAVDQLRPWTPERPVLVITGRPLAQLPYDLWAQGHRLALSLGDLFPELSPSVVRPLSWAQRRRLAAAPRPARRLGRRATQRYILRHVFAADLDGLRRPEGLLLWLARLHSELGPLPEGLRGWLLAELCGEPALAGWPLAELLGDGDAFRRWLGAAWGDYARRWRDRAEPIPRSHAVFDRPEVRHQLGYLVNIGLLTPVSVPEPEAAPAWARPGVRSPTADDLLRELEARWAEVRAQVAAEALTWEHWCAIAWGWAEATLLYARLPGERRPHPVHCAPTERLDERFIAWLRQNGGALAGQRLPRPHYVFHIPSWLAYRRRQGDALRPMILLILDGLALAEWLLIRRQWERTRDWRFEEHLVLAQVPSITGVSRRALVSGQSRRAFSGPEARGWRAFWATEGVPEERAILMRAKLGQPGQLEQLPEVDRFAVACLIDSQIDEISHGVRLGLSQLHQDIAAWLRDQGERMAERLEYWLDAGVDLYLASDHGHVEALGIGRPSGGILAQTRGQRVRIYGDRALARRQLVSFPGSWLWEGDPLLPEDWCLLFPPDRKAFANAGEQLITHGGITLEEMMVPLVRIERAL